MQHHIRQVNRRHQRPRAIRRRVLTHPNRRQNARRLRLRVRRLLLRRRALSISLPARRRRLLLLHLDPLRAEKVRHDIFQRDERGGVLESLRARPRPRRPTHSREPRCVRGSDARQRRRRRRQKRKPRLVLRARGGDDRRAGEIERGRERAARGSRRIAAIAASARAPPDGSETRPRTRRGMEHADELGRGEHLRAERAGGGTKERRHRRSRRRVAPGCGKRPIRRAALGSFGRSRATPRARAFAAFSFPISVASSASTPHAAATPSFAIAAAVSSAVGRHESAKDSDADVAEVRRRVRNPARVRARGFVPRRGEQRVSRS